MKTKCPAWAKEHVKWLTLQWDSVIFSDEPKFNLHGSDGREYVCQKSNKACHPVCIQKAVNFQYVKLFGAIQQAKKLRLKFISGTVNAERWGGSK
jgi:hypothetical protein